MLAHSRLRVASGPVTFSATNIIEVESRVRFRKNGVPLPTSNGIKQSITITAGTYPVGTTWQFTLGGPNTYTIPLEITWEAQIGDTIDVTIETTIINSSLYPGLTSDVKVLTSSTLFINPATNNLSAGEVYNKNSIPASQHKQKDFVMDIIRMFNLYLLWDGVNYVIEPRDTFYQLGTTLDWTDKVDRTNGINIKPVGQLTWKQLQFIAKKDADYYSEKYFTDTKEVYGQQNVLNGNEFVTETKKIELSFAPPLSVSSAANHPTLQHMYKLNNGVAEAIDGLPRYGYWAGWVEENTVFKRITGLGNVDYNGYSYVGEFNNPISPTLSVLFGPPRAVYYQTFGVLGITDNDLYSAYYQNELMNQVSANAKLITCYVYLTPLEINNLKLYDLVVVDGALCIISKISDYNTTTVQPTQVELIQFIQ
jgi:hypothetical protein